MYSRGTAVSVGAFWILITKNAPTESAVPLRHIRSKLQFVDFLIEGSRAYRRSENQSSMVKTEGVVGRQNCACEIGQRKRAPQREAVPVRRINFRLRLV